MEYTAGFLFAMTKGNLVFSPWSFHTENLETFAGVNIAVDYLPFLLLR